MPVKIHALFIPSAHCAGRGAWDNRSVIGKQPKKRTGRSMRHPRAVRPLMGKRDKHLLEGTALAVFAGLIVASFLVSSLAEIMVRSNQAAAVVTSVLIDLTNQNRTQNSLPELMVSPLLTEAAQEKADDEAANGYFAHVSPAGKDPWYWFEQAGYKFTYAGENLAVNFTDSQAVVTAWMNSPEHRANILNSNYTQIGIATAQGTYEGQPTIFVVQEFGSPAATPTQQPVRAQSVPATPTQVAVATTNASSANPEILGVESKDASGQGSSGSRAAPTPSSAANQNAARELASTDPAPIMQNPAPSREEIAATAPYPAAKVSAWALLASSPETTLRYAYYVIAFFVILALAITTELEFKLHHMRKFAAAGALLALMLGLFFLGNAFVFSNPTIAQTASTAQASSL